MQPSFETRLKTHVGLLSTGNPVEIGGKGLEKKIEREGGRGEVTKQPSKGNELKPC